MKRNWRGKSAKTKSSVEQGKGGGIKMLGNWNILKGVQPDRPFTG